MFRLPGDRTKNHLAHDVPLTRVALAILNAQPVRDGRDFVFGDGLRSNGQNGVDGGEGAFRAGPNRKPLSMRK
jgi:hypothetical protein